MSIELTILILLLIGVGTSMLIRKIDMANNVELITEAQWQQAISSEKSQLGRTLVSSARPFASLPTIQNARKSGLYSTLENKLLASGLFARSLEVFLAVQAFAIFIALIALLAVLLLPLSTMMVVAGAIICFVISAYPLNQVNTAAKKQATAVAKGLPEFAELLQMPLAAGVGVKAALRFTSDRQEGPVSDTVKALLSNIASRTMSEEEAFDLAGRVLGTPESAAFFVALKQADLEGNKVSDLLDAQAKALRSISYQQSRAEAKKLPTKIIIIFFIHLLPLLILSAMIPTFYGLANV